MDIKVLSIYTSNREPRLLCICFLKEKKTNKNRRSKLEKIYCIFRNGWMYCVVHAIHKKSSRLSAVNLQTFLDCSCNTTPIVKWRGRTALPAVGPVEVHRCWASCGSVLWTASRPLGTYSTCSHYEPSSWRAESPRGVYYRNGILIFLNVLSCTVCMYSILLKGASDEIKKYVLDFLLC